MMRSLFLLLLLCSTALAKVEDGKPVPDLSLKDVKTGTVVKLSAVYGDRDTRGVVFLISASWCNICVKAAVILQARQTELLANKVRVVALDASKQTKEFVEKNSITYPVLQDADGQIAETWADPYFPMTYVINHAGVLVGRVQGFNAQTYAGDLAHALDALK
jgi:peroxiredoxin